MSRSGPLAGLPAAQLVTFADRLLMGLGMQLRSMPVELRINAWLAERHPELRAVQGVMARLQLQENAKALATRASVPAKVFRASIAMNAATALYWAGFLQDDSLAAPYREAGYLIDGKALLKAWHALDASPEADRALIDAWAIALNLRGWFQWLPYATPLGQARARSGEPD